MTLTAAVEYSLDHDPSTGEVDALRTALGVHGAVVITADSRHRRLAATYPVPGAFREALDAAHQLAETATPVGGTLAALEVRDVSTLMVRSERAVPELVGKAGAAKILDITRQALDQRIDTDPTFPRGYDVDGRQAFMRAAVEAYKATHVRKPPGPAKGTPRRRSAAG